MDQHGFAFDMTVIVPVYNAERYVERCVLSLDAQKMHKHSFEVILVNDGSTDGSRELCDAIVAMRPNYTCIHQKNRGVSAARNEGIRNARGRYLMFLDGDDTISPTSIECLVASFDRFGDAVDLVTYPLRYVDALDGYEHTNTRYKWLKKTGVYNLAEYPFIAQTSVNVCVRNLGCKTPLFDKRFSHSEDQLFNTLVLCKKNAIGFCAEAQYRYYRVSTSVTMLHDVPQTSFDDVILVFEEYLRLAREHTQFARYAYALLLYNVSWRMRERKLIPNFGSEVVRERNHRRLAQVLRGIPRESWLESPHVPTKMRDFLAVSYELDWAGEAKPVALGTIDWMTLEASCFTIKGFVQISQVFQEVAPVLCVDIDGEKRELPMEPEQAGDWRFELRLPVLAKKAAVATFAIGGVLSDALPVDLRFNPMRTNGRSISAHVRQFGKTTVSFAGNALCFGSIRTIPQWATPVAVRLALLKDRAHVLPSSRKLERTLRMRLVKAAATNNAKRVWVYVDSFTEAIHGLAYQLFECELQKDDGVTRVYLTNDQGLAERLEVFMQAECVFSSAMTPVGPYPCGMRLWSRIADFERSQTFTLVSRSQASLAGTCYDNIRVL